MERSTWHTKDDVLADLARASGRRVPDLDEGCFVYGGRAPPPRSALDEDAEVEQRFGRAPAAGAPHAPAPAPDLRGITKMLRIVENCDDTDCIKADTSSNDVIVISKLNPHHSKLGLTTPKSTTDVTLSSKLNSTTSNLEVSAPTSTNDAVSSNKLNHNLEVISPKSTNDLTLSSKLNPDVKEFVPKWKASPLCSQIIGAKPSTPREAAPSSAPREAAPTSAPREAAPTSAPREAAPARDVSAVLGCKELQRGQVTINTTDINTNIGNKSEQDFAQYQIERDELAAMLRNKICSAPKQEDDGFQFRRRKYAAIANLLKLHSTPPPAHPVKLCTPQYFESCKPPGPPRVERVAPDPAANLQYHEQTTLTPELEATLHLGVQPEHIAVGQRAVEPSPQAEQQLEEEATDAADQLEVTASIHKVTNWFENKPCVPAPPTPPAPPAAPALHLGPIAYKRKERAGAALSPLAGAAERKLPRAACDRAYVPTQHARELGLQYAARAASPPPSPLTIWDKLELDLKRKDKELRERAQRRDARPAAS